MKKSIKSSLPSWTLQDTFAAYRDGWGLFQEDSGKIVVQRLDDPAAAPEAALVTATVPVFDCDESARKHVKSAARRGIALAKRALTYAAAVNGKAE